MVMYMITVGCLRFAVSFLLLWGTACFSSVDRRPLRLLLAALAGGIYACLCLLPDMLFLGNNVLYFLMLLFMGAIAFGKQPTSVYAICVFVLTNLMLDAIVSEPKGMLKIFLAVAGLLAICWMHFRGGRGRLVPVELTHKGKTVSFMALRDTGNMLTDPITGKSVLVVGADVADQLLGLTKQQLQKPVDTVGLFPGLRLIPYRTIGQQGAMMLAMQFPQVKIGKHNSGVLVAFAPENIGSDAGYRALAGGYV